jgi:hypothetical protein
VKTTTDMHTLHELTMSYLRPKLQPALWIEGIKYCSQASYLVRPLQGSCLQQMAQKTKERGKKEKKTSSCLYLKLFDKTGSTLPHKAQNTKHQYQDWMSKE